eukprot:TRINITY_DN37552_c0_g2_i1.p1 TRINITY_DN37552_c0_g2~~TRINITY_DN37552_c0_g2_i1.p1  ORF type:complete len:806 (-),score=112.86 TRINITY_DN37552_c0_g2_i1:97-2514(-)
MAHLGCAQPTLRGEAVMEVQSGHASGEFPQSCQRYVAVTLRIPSTVLNNDAIQRCDQSPSDCATTSRGDAADVAKDQVSKDVVKLEYLEFRVRCSDLVVDSCDAHGPEEVGSLGLPASRVHRNAGEETEVASRTTWHMQFRLPQLGLSWFVPLPFEVDPDAPNANLVAKFRRRRSALIITGFPELQGEGQRISAPRTARDAEIGMRKDLGEGDGEEMDKEAKGRERETSEKMPRNDIGEQKQKEDDSEESNRGRREKTGDVMTNMGGDGDRGYDEVEAASDAVSKLAERETVEVDRTGRPFLPTDTPCLKGATQHSPAQGEDDQICRYCFCGQEDGLLVSPCKCTGGQRYVHMSCLRQWQRMVVVTQPTHPAFWRDDVRQHKCNVCLAEFTCPPPSRHELMQSFTGSELAALLSQGCIIGSHEVFSNELEDRLQEIPQFARAATSYTHWIRGIYLITEVQEKKPRTIRLPLESRDASLALQQRLESTDGLHITVQGHRFRLLAQDSLADVTEQDLPAALKALRLPAVVALASDADCGEDHITAVNIVATRKAWPSAELMEREARKGCPEAASVKVQHYVGGPCDEQEIACCLVLGGMKPGWTIVRSLANALRLAASRDCQRCKGQGDFAIGQTVRLKGLCQSPGLNGEVGLALHFLESAGRWFVRLRDGTAKQVRPENLEIHDGGRGVVLVFWGDAQWSRAQLLGEIARGHWGLCRATAGDLAVSADDRWQYVRERLAFAPVSEMTEDFMRESQRQMVTLRAGAGRLLATQSSDLTSRTAAAEAMASPSHQSSGDEEDDDGHQML